MVGKRMEALQMASGRKLRQPERASSAHLEITLKLGRRPPLLLRLLLQGG